MARQYRRSNYQIFGNQIFFKRALFLSDFVTGYHNLQYNTYGCKPKFICTHDGNECHRNIGFSIISMNFLEQNDSGCPWGCNRY